MIIPRDTMMYITSDYYGTFSVISYVVVICESSRYPPRSTVYKYILPNSSFLLKNISISTINTNTQNINLTHFHLNIILTIFIMPI